MSGQKRTTIKKIAKDNFKRNWYADRYVSTVIQRNIFALFSFFCIVAIVILVFSMQIIFSKKSVEPFIIEMEDKTGLPTIVEAESKQKYTADEMMQKYFIYKYLVAREGYLPNIYNYNYRQVVRVFSSPTVYREFFNHTYGPQGAVTKYGQFSKVMILIKSIQYLEKDLVQIRFVQQIINEKNVLQKELHKISVLRFKFLELALDFKEKIINPLGFQISFYKKDDDFIM